MTSKRPRSDDDDAHGDAKRARVDAPRDEWLLPELRALIRAQLDFRARNALARTCHAFASEDEWVIRPLPAWWEPDAIVERSNPKWWGFNRKETCRALVWFKVAGLVDTQHIDHWCTKTDIAGYERSWGSGESSSIYHVMEWSSAASSSWKVVVAIFGSAGTEILVRAWLPYPGTTGLFYDTLNESSDDAFDGRSVTVAQDRLLTILRELVRDVPT